MFANLIVPGLLVLAAICFPCLLAGWLDLSTRFADPPPDSSHGC